MNIFYTLITQPITNVLIAIYQLLHLTGLPYALGFSIIVLTVLIRLILYPLISSQMRASKKMQEIQPHLNRLKEKHKGDSQKLQMETMQLYKEFGINPLAGCLPVLLQLPVIWGLYGVLNSTVRATSFQEINKAIYLDTLKLNSLWDTHFFGLPLSQSPAQLMKDLGLGVLLVPIITGVLQFYQSKQMFQKPKTVNANKEKKADDFASAMQTQSLYVFPIMIGFFSNSFPLGLSLYWNTFTIFGIIQQYLMDRTTKSKAVVSVPKDKSKKK